MKEILQKLNLEKINPGASFGKNCWSNTTNLGQIDSINPATNEIIGSVYRPSAKDYEQLMQSSQKAFLTWREVPAPKRGEMVRQISQLIREKKSLLGSLVSLESGKSLQEGAGEVQEMIDMADFAVGQSRMLYGKTMPSERPAHRMYEQWHLSVLA